jgi:uncharacterized protein
MYMDGTTLNTASQPQERLLSLDLIRGVAILGILLLNIYGFALPPDYSLSLLWNDGQYNQADWFKFQLDQWLLQGRFLSLFALLFGVSLYLLQQKSIDYTKKRLYWLILIGFCHLNFWWFGDILFWYGITGMLLLKRGYLALDSQALWRQGHKFLGIALLVPCLIWLGSWWQLELFQFAGANPEQQQQMIDSWTGSYSDQIRQLWSMFWIGIVGYVLSLGWLFAALMLYGVALYKSDWFRHGFSTQKTVILFVCGSLLSGSSLLLHYGTDYQLTVMGPTPMNEIASVLMALCYGSILIKLANRPPFWLHRWLVPCGRMAFSLYLLQSLCMVLLFRFIKPEWFCKLDSLQMTAIALAAIVVQLLLCRGYLHYFSQGPLEWLWRRLSQSKTTAAASTSQPSQCNIDQDEGRGDAR